MTCAILLKVGLLTLTLRKPNYPQGIDVDEKRPPSPGGSGDPVLFEDESEDADK